jgi:carbon-monoxide dehydrogenase medium subunit
MDSGPAMIALEALVTVASSAGRRQMPLGELFVSPRKTSLKPGDLLVDIVIAKQNLSKPAAFEKFGLRKGQALALVNVGAAFFIDKGNFLCPRIALGAVAPTVIRAPKAEAYLEGRKISAEAMAEAGRIAATEAKPISDFRASADYRRDLVAVLVKRALASAQARAAAKQKELAA